MKAVFLLWLFVELVYDKIIVGGTHDTPSVNFYGGVNSLDPETQFLAAFLRDFSGKIFEIKVFERTVFPIEWHMCMLA